MEKKRSAPRIDSLNLISYIFSDREGNILGQGMGRTLNISEGGILLESSASAPLDLAEIFTLEMALEENIIQVKGKLIYSRKGDGGRFVYGIQFVTPSDETRNLLKAYAVQFATEPKEV